MDAPPGSEAAVDVRVDCTGMLCPMPIYKASMALAKMERGQTLLVTATDPGSLKDFPALARQAGHELIETRQTGPGTWDFTFRKGGRP